MVLLGHYVPLPKYILTWYSLLLSTFSFIYQKLSHMVCLFDFISLLRKEGICLPVLME